MKKEEETKSQIEKIIEIKNKEREIADLFYELCPHVPPQILGLTVRQTIENFKELENLYNPNIETKLYKQKVQKIPSVIKEQKMLDDNYLNIPRID